MFNVWRLKSLKNNSKCASFLRDVTVAVTSEIAERWSRDLCSAFRHMDPWGSGDPNLQQIEAQELKSRKPHVKKPLNAFMLFMKEQRAKVIAESSVKESAAINQILGRRVSFSAYLRGSSC